MKFFYAALLILVSFSSYAVEFKAKYGLEECRMANHKVETTFIQAKGKMRLTTTKDYKLSGVDEFIQKAMAVSSQREMVDGYYKMIVAGQEYNLHPDDSLESMMLIRLISKACF
jgi:hypothetical protein